MKATYIDHMGSDLSVVNAARVSFGKKHEEFMDKDVGLINFLAREGHLSPFNHTFITMHMKAPIFVARQLQKHEYMPWNEISRRYVDDEPELYWPEVWRGRPIDKKQGSSGTVEFDDKVFLEITDALRDIFNAYDTLLDENVAPEQARMILPQNTYTEWYWSGTLGAWTKMYNLRSKPDAQQETRELVLQCGKILENLYPVSFKALTNSEDVV